MGVPIAIRLKRGRVQPDTFSSVTLLRQKKQQHVENGLSVDAPFTNSPASSNDLTDVLKIVKATHLGCRALPNFHF